MAKEQLKAIQTSQIKAGIHTVELSYNKKHGVKFPRTDGEQIKPPYINGYPSNGKIQINPHRYYKTGDKYRCLYGNRTDTENAIRSIAAELQLKTWGFNRIDYSFDFSCDYNNSYKLIQLLLLMIAEKYDMNNNYKTDDPQTGEHKTMRIGYKPCIGKQGSYEAEHYNRSLKDQSSYDTEVVNRLELRTMGAYLDDERHERNLRQCLLNWLNMIDQALTDEVLTQVESRQAEALYNQWSCKKSEMKQIRQFLKSNEDKVYTRGQIRKLFELETGSADKAKAQTTELLKKCNGFSGVELYSLFDLKELAACLWLAARDYLAS